MYPAVLAARMTLGPRDRAGHGKTLFLDQPRLRPRNPFPWDNFVGRPPGTDLVGGHAPNSGHRGLEPTRGLLVLGRPGVIVPAALNA